MAEFTVYAGAASGWDSSSNATGEPDGSYAYESHNSDGFKYLTLSNFGITDELPANAVIDKVTVSAKVKANSGTSTDEIYMRVYARINGVDQAKSFNSKIWPVATVLYKSYGQYPSSDALDPSNLTDALFTARVSAEFVNMIKTKKAECDYVAVTVEYHIPSVGLEMGCNF